MNTFVGPLTETLHGQLFWVLLLLPISGAVWLAMRAKAKRNNTPKNRVFRRVFGFCFSLVIVWNLLLSSIHYTAIFYSGPFSIQVVDEATKLPIQDCKVLINWDVAPPPIFMGWWSLIIADVTSSTGWQKVDENGTVRFIWQGWRFWQRGADYPTISVSKDRITVKEQVAYPSRDFTRGSVLVISISADDIVRGNALQNRYRIQENK